MVSQVSFSPGQCCAAGGCVGAFMMWVLELLRSAKRMCKWSCKFVWIKIRYEKLHPYCILPVHFLYVPNSADSEHFVFSTWSIRILMNFDSLRGAPEALHIVDSKGISCVTCEGSWRRSIYEASSEDVSCHHGNQFPNFIWKSWTWSFFRPK